MLPRKISNVHVISFRIILNVFLDELSRHSGNPGGKMTLSGDSVKFVHSGLL